MGKNTKVGAKSELIRCVTHPGYEMGTEGVLCDERYWLAMINVCLQRATEMRDLTCQIGQLPEKRVKTRRKRAQMVTMMTQPALARQARANNSLV